MSSTTERIIGVTTAGYTEEQRLYSNSPGNDANLSASWKIMGASPDSSVTVSGTGGSTDAGAVAIHVWRGVNQATPFDVAETTDSGTGTPQANPAQIGPVTPGSVVLAIGAGAAASLTEFTSPDLSNFFSAASADDNDVVIGMGSIAWSGSGVVNPGQFGGGGSSNSNRSWAAVTLALRPQTSVAYTLPANAGGHGVAGVSALLRKALKMGAATGVHTVFGTSARLGRGYGLAAVAGLHALIGTAAVFRKTLRLAAAAGSHVLAGASNLLRRGYSIAAADGGYVASGEGAELSADLREFTAAPPERQRILMLPRARRISIVRASPDRIAMSPAQARNIVLMPLRRGRQA